MLLFFLPLLFFLLPALDKRIARRRLTGWVLLSLLTTRPLALLLHKTLLLTHGVHELLIAVRADAAAHQRLVEEILLHLHLLAQPERRR
jgi:hypothetical protein